MGINSISKNRVIVTAVPLLLCLVIPGIDGIYGRGAIADIEVTDTCIGYGIRTGDCWGSGCWGFNDVNPDGQSALWRHSAGMRLERIMIDSKRFEPENDNEDPCDHNMNIIINGFATNFWGSWAQNRASVQVIINECLENDYEIVLTILRGFGAPDWFPTPPYTEEELAEWGEYCYMIAAYVTQWWPEEERIKFEIENEPFWYWYNENGEMTKEEYLSILIEGDTQIRNAYTDAGMTISPYIIAQGGGPMDFWPQPGATDFMRYYIRHGHNYIDGVSYHHATSTGWYDGHPQDIQTMKDWITELSPDRNLDLWCSEWFIPRYCSYSNWDVDNIKCALGVGEVLIRHSKEQLRASILYELFAFRGQNGQEEAADKRFAPIRVEFDSTEGGYTNTLQDDKPGLSRSYYAFRAMARCIGTGRGLYEVDIDEPESTWWAIACKAESLVVLNVINTTDEWKEKIVYLGDEEGTLTTYLLNFSHNDEVVSINSYSGIFNYTFPPQSITCFELKDTTISITEDPRILIYSLLQNYPNPFSKRTKIQYALKNTEHVSLKIYASNGNLIKILVDEKKNPGYYTILWDGKDDNYREVKNGVYFCRFRAGNYQTVKKIIVLKQTNIQYHGK